MAIFGLKSRKSYSSDTSSINKHNKRDSLARNHNLEASDVIGDSPDFRPSSNARGQNPDTASLRSHNSIRMKKFFGSTRRKGTQSIDAGNPARPSSSNNTPSSEFGAVSKYASHSSLNRVASPPVVIGGGIAPSLSTPTGGEGSFADAVGQSVSGGLVGSSLPSGPRPSELFAGKGVQWDQVDLTGKGNITKPVDAPATSAVDMQKFLKERRQWIPTFKDSNEADEDANINLPKSLDQFSFETPAEVSKASAGLKSVKDLEDTHKRKAALLDPTPLAAAGNGAIFEEAGTSVKASGSSSGVAAQPLPPAPAPPSRNQSFRTSAFTEATVRPSGSISRKAAPSLGVNGDASSTDTRDIPQRRSSVRKDHSELEDAPAQPNGTTTTRPTTATSAAETGGFATPIGSQTHSDPMGPTQDSNITVTAGDIPPRPPKNGQRAPSRQTSTDNVGGSPVKKGTVAEQVEKVEETLPKMAPSLGNAIPGMGAATTEEKQS